MESVHFAQSVHTLDFRVHLVSIFWDFKNESLQHVYIKILSFSSKDINSRGLELTCYEFCIL